MKRTQFVIFGLSSMCGIALIMFLFSEGTHSQDKVGSKTVSVTTEEHTQSESYKLYGQIYPIVYKGGDLRQFTLSQPLPEIWFFMPESENSSDLVRVNLSEKARQILYKHWLKQLELRYLVKIEEIHDSETMNLTVLTQSTIDSKKELLKTSISDQSPRNISSGEASQLMIIVRDSADEVITQIQENLKKQTPTGH